MNDRTMIAMHLAAGMLATEGDWLDERVIQRTVKYTDKLLAALARTAPPAAVAAAVREPLEARIAAIVRERDAAFADYARLEAERDGLAREFRTMTCMWEGLRTKIDELRTELAAAKAEIERLNRMYGNAVRAIRQLAGDSSEHRAVIKILRAAVDAKKEGDK